MFKIVFQQIHLMYTYISEFVLYFAICWFDYFGIQQRNETLIFLFASFTLNYFLYTNYQYS